MNVVVDSSRELAGSVQSKTPAAGELLSTDSERDQRERWARTPLIPLIWIRGMTLVTPEEAGERKAGRPKMNVSQPLTLVDLDRSLLMMQKRTQAVQKLVKGLQPSADQTSKIVRTAIKDAIMRLSENLPEKNRNAIGDVVAGI